MMISKHDFISCKLHFGFCDGAQLLHLLCQRHLNPQRAVVTAAAMIKMVIAVTMVILVAEVTIVILFSMVTADKVISVVVKVAMITTITEIIMIAMVLMHPL